MGEVYRDLKRKCPTAAQPLSGTGSAAHPAGAWGRRAIAEVYVRAFPPSNGPGGKWQISNNGGSAPRWSADGHGLQYRAKTQVMAVSYTVNGDTFVAGKPSVWIAKMGTVVNGWDLAPDGKRALVLSEEESAEGARPEHEVVLLENFFDYLRQRALVKK
jgi:hypothetical protein